MSNSTIKTRHRQILRLGYVPLCDCAPLVMARELGLFEKHGLRVELCREVGWATIRDRIFYGELDAAHALAAMPMIASAGIGSVQVQCVTGLVINLHGNAITLSERLWTAGVEAGITLRQAEEGRREPFVFGIPQWFSAHHFVLLEWLASANLKRDVQLVVVPPPQMPANLKNGHLDGYCVGEPWNSVAVFARSGWCVATSAEIAPRHPEKVLMVRREFAESRREEHECLIAALIEACRFCQAPQNRERVIETLSGTEYLDAPVRAIRNGMGGQFDFGHGRIEKVSSFNVFAGDDTNVPDARKAAWLLDRLTEVLPDPGSLDRKRAAECFRPDIYQRSLLHIPTTK
jgi:ABC-type nitrate/sulfonate/bicarbonate transport system substrate-binding protein